jgi:hypothetical protein
MKSLQNLKNLGKYSPIDKTAHLKNLMQQNKSECFRDIRNAVNNKAIETLQINEKCTFYIKKYTCS